MSNPFPPLLALVLLGAPLALAHDPAGTPKLYCESSYEARVHDYGPPATSVPPPLWAHLLFQNGHDASLPGPRSCLHPWPDTHNEWGPGAAVLEACPFDCGSGGDGWGSRLCLGTDPHHSVSSVHVDDLVLGADAEFLVAADRTVYDGGPGVCGDGELDHFVRCRGSCAVPFGPGYDGAFYVFVEGTQGHVTSA